MLLASPWRTELHRADVRRLRPPHLDLRGLGASPLADGGGRTGEDQASSSSSAKCRWRDLVADPANDLLLSAASSWELAIKVAIGRLTLPEPAETYVPSRMAAVGVTGVAVEHVHALAVARLPMHHRDPFDRLLVAQAALLAVPILTADDAFDAYDVEVLKARA